MRCPPSSIFFLFCNEPIWLTHHSKKTETLKTPQNKSLYFEVYSSSPLAQLYRWKEDNNCQSIWDKSEVLWRTSWEHVKNMMGNYWELKGNMVVTYWEPEKNEKKSCCPTPPNLKGKNARHLQCLLESSHWLHEISLCKRVPNHFWPGLIPFATNTLPI
jgi:hypothetical protein